MSRCGKTCEVKSGFDIIFKINEPELGLYFLDRHEEEAEEDENAFQVSIVRRPSPSRAQGSFRPRMVHGA